MGTKDDSPLSANMLSPEEAELFERLKKERDRVNPRIGDEDILDNIIHRERDYELHEVEGIIIRELINKRSKDDLDEAYDKAMKGLG